MITIDPSSDSEPSPPCYGELRRAGMQLGYPDTPNTGDRGTWSAVLTEPYAARKARRAAEKAAKAELDRRAARKRATAATKAAKAAGNRKRAAKAASKAKSEARRRNRPTPAGKPRRPAAQRPVGATAQRRARTARQPGAPPYGPP